MKDKDRNCLDCPVSKRPGWTGNCGTCPTTEPTRTVPRSLFDRMVREAGGTLPEVGTQVVEVVPGPRRLASALWGAWRRARARSLVLGHPGGQGKGRFPGPRGWKRGRNKI